jgi:hypothetical protein
MKEIVKKIDQNLLGGSLRKAYIKFFLNLLLLRTLNFKFRNKFLLNGKEVRFYLKGHNINYPIFRMTERCLELALADLFLKRYVDVIEIGAVTPYYWPNRISTIIDPYDKHMLVTDRVDWLNYERTAEAILSISTFEHIGLDDYGLHKDELKCEFALNKLLNSKADFLVTWPGGYNPTLDVLVLKLLRKESNVKLYCWQRGEKDNHFLQVEPNDLTPPLKYGPYWANTVFVLHKGSPLL